MLLINNIKRFSIFLLAALTVMTSGRVMSASDMENLEKDKMHILKKLKKITVPQNIHMKIGTLGIEKKGENVTLTHYESMISTMPGEPRTEEKSKKNIDMDLFEKLWEAIKSFDFSEYKKILDKGKTIDNPEMDGLCDAEFTFKFFLSLEGKELVRADFGTMIPKDKKLYSNLKEFHKELWGIVKTRQAKDILAKVKVPSTLLYEFGYSIKLEKTDKSSQISLRYPSEKWDDKENGFEEDTKNRDEILKLAKKNDKVTFNGSNIIVEISENDFLRFWQEIKEIDPIRFVSPGNDDFDFVKCEFTTGLALVINDKTVIHWAYVDMVLKSKTRKPLDQFNELLEKEFYSRMGSIAQDMKKLINN